MENMVRIGAAAAALGLSVDTLRRWERDGRIAFERHGGQRYLRADALASLLRERSTHERTSARNRMAGVVVAVQRDGVMAQVDLACGPYRIVSLMSREAVDDLDLRPGMAASAVIKATNVIVER
ncbi:MAG: MerR family transcriptional regulator [Conexibacter sp.]|jgi:molybdopterin-binding protein|nr:MerR family transcriptional regulator [Conexibacter sp.]